MSSVNRVHLSSMLSVMAKPVNTYVHVIFVCFFFCFFLIHLQEFEENVFHFVIMEYCM